MTTGDPLLAAVERLRASVDALPEYLRADVIIRTKPATWEANGPYVVVAGHGVVAHAAATEVDEHIALVASPSRVLLLADLLAKAAAINEITYNYHRGVSDLVDAAAALASHLTEGSTTGG